MLFCVYILYSASLDKFYVGYTAQLEERFLRHNQKSKGFTGKAKDWLLVYQEEYSNQKEALVREKQIKSWKSKIKIEALIKNN